MFDVARHDKNRQGVPSDHEGWLWCFVGSPITAAQRKRLFYGAPNRQKFSFDPEMVRASYMFTESFCHGKHLARCYTLSNSHPLTVGILLSEVARSGRWICQRGCCLVRRCIRSTSSSTWSTSPRTSWTCRCTASISLTTWMGNLCSL